MIRLLFAHEDTKPVLLVDATNGFNSLNRQLTLCNIQHICQTLANILINTCREPTGLFVDGQGLWLVEVTTQGDPLAMPLYVLATIPLIDQLSSVQNVTHVWYADDASAAVDLP